MKPKIGRTILGGFLGTVVMTMMMYKGAPMMIGVKMDIAERLGSMFGDSWALGMGIHWISGVIVFPLTYAVVVAGCLPGKTWQRGIGWGIILWLIAQVVLMPLTSGGFFSSNIGGMKVAMASLMGHIVYGAILGIIAGGTKSSELAST